ncbi:unnamed protein product [Cunninghamella echinulata]
MAVRNIRNHPYNFETTLQEQQLQQQQRQRHNNNNNSNIKILMNGTQGVYMNNSNNNNRQKPRYYTWLVFQHSTWVPFDSQNQQKLEQTHNLGGTFVDIEDSHFPDVKRVRIFPKSNYLSYLGVKYRLSRLQEPDAWLDPPPDEMDLIQQKQQQQYLISLYPHNNISHSFSFSSLINNELSSRLLPIPKPSSCNTYPLPKSYII